MPASKERTRLATTMEREKFDDFKADISSPNGNYCYTIDSLLSALVCSDRKCLDKLHWGFNSFTGNYYNFFDISIFFIQDLHKYLH